MKKLPIARNLYLIVRGNCKADDYPIIICSQYHTAKWEAGSTKEQSTVFQKQSDSESGLLLLRHKGFDIDYGTVVDSFKLYDGTNTGFNHKDSDNWNLMQNAIWWSYDTPPQWLLDFGLKFANDNFTRQRILDDSGLCLLPHSKAEKITERLDNFEYPEWLSETII